MTFVSSVLKYLMSFLSSLNLTHFRCYDTVKIDGLSSGLIVLTGANGAGKTNILEAISLLSPGRGLRSARLEEIQKQDQGHPWGVSAMLETSVGPVKLGTGIDPQKPGKRAVRINGAPAKSQSALSDFIACLWLTPAMDRLFLDGSSGRRRFFDKLVFTFDPGHAGRVSRYENALRQRAKLLAEGNYDPSWLDALEQQMAQTGVAIAAARLEFCQKLQTACDQADARAELFFPKARLAMAGSIETLLRTEPALKVEEMFAYQLLESRLIDAQKGGAASGPHKADLSVHFAAKDMPADQCSTGEQKALLIGIVLAHSALMAAERGAPPILLLDEIAAHLDEDRRAALFEKLTALGGQTFMTGTDQSLFSACQNQGQFFTVEQAEISKQKQYLAA